MNLLPILLAKDFRRALRNPWRWLVHLALPLSLTGLLGLAFGRGDADGSGLGKIKMALVDEDHSHLTRLIQGALTQPEAARHVELFPASRAEAVQRLREDHLSAVLIVPESFTADYLAGRSPKPLDLIKNPAQAIHPALVEEGLGVVVTALNTISRTLGSAFPLIESLFAPGEPVNFRALSRLMDAIGERMDAIRPLLSEPLVVYKNGVKEDAVKDRSKPGRGFNLLGFLLPGLASVFLLYMADQALRDLFKEQSGHTLHRFSTIHHGLGCVVLGKVLFALVVVWLGSLILFGGGGLLFGIQWERLGPMAVLVGAYGFLAAGLLSLLAAAAGTEKRASVLSNVVIMALAFVGGGYFPASQLPSFLKEHVSPWLPNYWFIEALRGLRLADGKEWLLSSAKLILLGMLCAGAAAWWLQRRLEKGVRP